MRIKKIRIPLANTKKVGAEKEKGSEVTLFGLLNFIDALWSACGTENHRLYDQLRGET